ncbi:lytic transglycosylase domain-containing protein [Nocardia cyriacigeorgica]|nr:transglycosylase SLT domain-containing protein [Nocardia cyriacigeorgica]
MPDYSAGSASVDIKPAFRGFVRQLRRELERVDASLDVEVRPDQQSLATFEQTVRSRLAAMDLSVDVRIGADTSAAAAELAAFRQAAGSAMTINVDADTSAAAARIAALRGTSVGVNVTGNSGRGGSGGGGGFGAAGILNAGALGISQLPAAASALATIGTDIQALTQSAALLPGIYAGASAAIATLVVGMQGMKDAFSDSPEKAAEAMEGMADSAREAVTAVRDYSDEWTTVRKTVQQNLFADTAEPIRTAIDTQLPVLEAGMGGIATKFNEGMRTALGELGSDESAGALTQIFDRSGDAAGRLNGAITPVINTVRTLGTTGSNFLPELAQNITDLTVQFDTFITKADQSGDLSRWMREGIDAASTLLSIIGNLGSSLTSALRAAKGDGDGFLVTVDNLTERMSTWLSSDVGQSQMREFFVQGREQLDQWRPVLESVGTVLKSLYDASQAWSAILLPFLQAAAGLLEGQEGTVTTLLTAWLAYKTLSPILSGIQTGIQGVTTRVDAFRSASSAAATAGVSPFRSALSGIGAILGPGGLLGTAALGAAAFGIGLLAQKHQEAKRAAEEQKQALEALGRTLDEQTGKVTDQTVDQVTRDLESRGFLERAQTLGINPQDYVQAGLGLDPVSKDAINARLTRIIMEQRGSAGGRWSDITTFTDLTDTDIAQALQGVPEAVTKYADAVAKAQQTINAAGGETRLADLSELKDGLNDIGESAATAGGEMNGLNTNTAKAAESVQRINEAKNGLWELTETGRKGFEDLGLAVRSVPDSKTVIVDSTTDEQQRKLDELGYTVTHMEDGTVKITLNDEAARAQIQELVKPVTKEVRIITLDGGREIRLQEGANAGAKPLPGRALGGEITGGIPGRDSVPILAMPGEHMLTTSDVAKMGGQAGVYRFRAALQAGLVRGFAGGGAVGWTQKDEINLQQAQAKIAKAEEKAQKVLDDPKSSDADKRLAQLAVDEARNDAQVLEAKKAGRSGPSTEVLPQAPLPERKSDRDIQIENAQMAVDDANTKRNQVYADPNSTDADRRKADNDYLSAQNARQKAQKSQGEEGDKLPEQYSLPGILGAAGTIIGKGILSFFGLENSILSDTNVYNRAFNETVDFYENKNKEAADSEADAGGYDYVPQNLPIETDDTSSSSSSDSSTSSSDSSKGEHAYDPGTGVEQWRPTFAAVLAALGMPSSWLGLGLAQMQSESGGNPRAINLWDSNAEKGIPSKGLMQVIDPTFQSYRSALYPNDIWDPSANIAAALRYLVARYGGPEGVWGEGHGYADGGWVPGIGGPRSDSIRARLSPGEFVVNAASAAANGDWLEAINAGLSLGVPALPPGLIPRGGDTTNTRDHSVNFHGDMHLMNVDHLMREQDRWATNQAMGALAAYT